MNAPGNHKSRQILQALIDGVDPETGTDLSNDTVLNRPDVIRALLASLSALDAVKARAQRRAQLPASVGKAWSDEEEWQLREEFKREESIPIIATKHARTIRAIETRLEKLGLLNADQRANPSSFVDGQGGGSANE
jgi:hypothetical protein